MNELGLMPRSEGLSLALAEGTPPGVTPGGSRGQRRAALGTGRAGESSWGEARGGGASRRQQGARRSLAITAALQSPWLLLPRSSRGEHLTAKATVIDTDVKGKRPCLPLLGGFRSFPGDSSTLPELGATAGEGT